MSNLNKFLVALIIIIALLVGALGYYTYFVYDGNKKESSGDIELKKSELEIEVDKNVLSFPYARIIDKNVSYDELNKAYIVSNAWEELNIDYENVEKQYSSNLKLTKDINNVKYSSYKKNTAQYIAKMLGLTVDEINKIDLDSWNKILGDNTKFYIIDGVTLKNKIKELSIDNDAMFNSSFIINKDILGNLDGVVSKGNIMYDKNIDKVIMHENGNTSGTVRKIYITSNELKNNVYKVNFVEGYFEEGTTYKLKAIDGSSIDVDITTVDKEFILNEALKNNHDKLDKYEITFKKVNDIYQFDSIKKI